MSDAYQYKKGSMTLGPYPIEKMRTLARQGLIGKSHQVAKNGSGFSEASGFPEIFQVAAAEPVGTAKSAEPTWFYTLGGKRQAAPATERHIANLIAAGSVTAADLVWNDKAGDEWLPVTAVEQFAAALPQPALIATGEENGSDSRSRRKRASRRVDKRSQEKPKTFNAMGLAGFICSVVAIVLLSVPCFVFIVAAESLFWIFHIVIPFTILAIVGLVFSSIGLRHVPRGMATTGTVLSIVALTLGIVAFLGWSFFPYRLAMQRRTLIDSRIADIKLAAKNLGEGLDDYRGAVRGDAEPDEVFSSRLKVLRRIVGGECGKLISAYNSHLTVTARTSEFRAAFDDLNRLFVRLKDVGDAAAAVEDLGLGDVLETGNVNISQLELLEDTLSLYQRGEITIQQAEAKMTGL